MENKKIFVTQQLISNIVTLRKERSLSSHELSEKTGHSKYWLSNIENGKTKKILKKDLISIYKILYQTDDNEEAIKTRLEVYRENSKELIAYYKEKGVLVTITPENPNAENSTEQVINTILEAIKR